MVTMRHGYTTTAVRRSAGHLRAFAAMLALLAYYELCRLTMARARMNSVEHDRMLRRLQGRQG